MAKGYVGPSVWPLRLLVLGYGITLLVALCVLESAVLLGGFGLGLLLALGCQYLTWPSPRADFTWDGTADCLWEGERYQITAYRLWPFGLYLTLQHRHGYVCRCWIFNDSLPPAQYRALIRWLRYSKN